ncbi:MAG: phosphoadenylyl-sulfate reductase [Betaproteobacteria bacterium]|nr:MAG: phosphoadenylyl-sulfate reductase [Betaproteobacteria bacterium]
MKTSNAISTRPWYQRPRPTVAPHEFEEKLSHAVELLKTAAALGPCVLAHSLSAEDMVLFHLIVENNLAIDAIALDTLRLPLATYRLWQLAETTYDRTIRRIAPIDGDLATLAQAGSDSAIYSEKSARELCCELRKTQPLRNALLGKAAWVTGLRRAQSVTRTEVREKHFDAAFGLDKFNPLAQWTDDDVWYFVDTYDVPISGLYNKGYASIGCDPCTRPIRADEHPRAGRWWWETDTAVGAECGIHIAATKTH